MTTIDISVIPGVRVSKKVKPEICVYAEDAVLMNLSVDSKGQKRQLGVYPLEKGRVHKCFPSMEDYVGHLIFIMEFFNDEGKKVGEKTYPYEVIESDVSSTTLIDGCWVDLYHWSEDEGRWFNGDLIKLTDEDWKEQIRAMAKLGIRGVVIQNIFQCDEYAGRHSMTTNTYSGKAFYPSDLYSSRFPIAAGDPIKAILEAAEECNMHVLIGIGLFAWFDFNKESLKWHKAVSKEVFDKYGHYKSFYGWYISEEMFGSLYYDYPPVEDDKYKDIVNFFSEYKSFVSQFAPTKPVALAPNNIRFHEYAKEWEEILSNIDIIIPFAFARDPENMNIREIAEICSKVGTHFWVDMEMFAWPLDNGLIPKTYNDLIREIRTYDAIEQIYGYEFTGIMNFPECQYNLGGCAAKKLYMDYSEYYQKITSY